MTAYSSRQWQINLTNQQPSITLPFLRSDKGHGLAREVCTKQTRALHVQLQLTAHCAAGHFACGRGSTGGFSFLFRSVMQGFNVTTGSVVKTMFDGYYVNYVDGFYISIFCDNHYISGFCARKPRCWFLWQPYSCTERKTKPCQLTI